MRCKREEVQAYLLTNISLIQPAGNDDPNSLLRLHAASFRLLRLAGAAPSPSLTDLACFALEPARVHLFNPFLTADAVCRLHAGVGVWLQLCVLEDRLERLGALAELGSEFEPTLIKVGRLGLAGRKKQPDYILTCTPV